MPLQSCVCIVVSDWRFVHLCITRNVLQHVLKLWGLGIYIPRMTFKYEIRHAVQVTRLPALCERQCPHFIGFLSTYTHITALHHGVAVEYLHRHYVKYERFLTVSHDYTCRKRLYMSKNWPYRYRRTHSQWQRNFAIATRKITAFS